MIVPKSVFCVSGCGGSNFFLRSLSFVQLNRWCSTVSSAWLHRGHAFSAMAPILFKWLFRGICWVLNLNMVAWSFLVSLSRLSLMFGVVICLNKTLPVVPIAHSFSHSSLKLERMICLRLFHMLSVRVVVLA